MQPNVIPLYRGQETVQKASAWAAFTRRIQDSVSRRVFGASVRELTIHRRLDITGGFRFARNLGLVDQTERQRKKRSRMENVEILRRMYKGENDWGNQLTGVITDFNAAMQWEKGIQVRPSREWREQHPDDENPPDPPELAPWQDFLEFNDLHQEGGLDLGILGELDGQMLMAWKPIRTAKNVKMWAVPLLETRYEIHYGEFWNPRRAVLYPGTDEEKELQPRDFVFTRLRGLHNGSYGIPTMARGIDDLIDLDKAKADWRKVNRLFSAPTPIFKAAGANGVDRIWNDINQMNWRIGQAFVLEGEDSYELVGLPAESYDSLLKEMIMLLQFASATSSLPVHFLGHPELMSNRAVAKEDFKPGVIHAGKAQMRQTGMMDELATKVLPTLGRMHGQDYNPNNIEHRFPAPAADVEGLIMAWLPATIAGKISHETFLTKCGIPDPQGEIKRILQEMERQPAPQGFDDDQAAAARIREIAERAEAEAAQGEAA